MIFQSLLLFTVIIGGILAVLTVGGSNIYDLRHIKLRRQFSRHPHARHYRQRPLISLIIPTRNDALLIKQTLESIAGSTYRKLEIIVVDSNSQDTTATVVRQFIADHPKRMIRLSAKRRPVPAIQAVADVYRAHAAGELVIWLQPGQLLDREALANAVRHFNSEPDLDGLVCSSRVGTAHTTASLFQHFEQLLSRRSQKFSSISNTDYAAAATGVLYNRTTASQLLPAASRKSTKNAGRQLFPLRLGNRSTHICYGSDAVLYSAPLASSIDLFRQRYRLQLRRFMAVKTYRPVFFARDASYTLFLTWFRLPLAVGVGLAALCIPILLTYFIYLAVSLHQPALYVLSWALLTLFMVLAIWDDERLKLRQKAAYTLLSPIVQPAFYVLSFVQLFVILRVFLGTRKPVS